MNHSNKEQPNQSIGLGIAIGAGGGVALGLVMMQIFNNPGFFALGIAIGASIGTAIGAALGRQGDEEYDSH